MNTRWTIAGQGLAGTCLAWALWQRRQDFVLLDRGTGGSSRVAAGMINPVTGKNFEPSWRIADFLPDALGFYAKVEERIGRKIWHPFPVLRLAASEKEWRKIVAKREVPSVARWMGDEVPAPAGWVGAVKVNGGGRLDTRAFLDGSREFFAAHFRSESFGEKIGPHEIRCDGAEGLMTGRFGGHRCAKGEILTVHAPAWDESQIRVGGGGWLVPLGGENFKVGSTYEWDELDEKPTAEGQAKVEEIAARLGGGDFRVIAHEAGIRPILRRSQPLIGPLDGGGWMFNGLGSKGSLYAPGIAARLADWLVEGTEPEPDLDYRKFRDESH